ncbi:glycerol kinase GlpK [Brevundimonas sp. 2R-24]|uniref:Glycerol kinase GlpK n=1 Tax=Peiella sedimenti TaxID=3061083 RepID=A0ABT8SH76_9CAUL|nr:glycerol kinase GlpK [Caulobacteraceae bacterium XZ-24]
MPDLILAIDQGTTSTRAIVFDQALRPVALKQIALKQSYPQPGWVEHDAEEIWQAALQTCREAVREAGGVERIAAIGLTNQRETVVLWERATGRPLAPAIVWQDRRTAEVCAGLRGQGLEDEVRARTGLLLDPYFSATKAAWLLDRVEGARARAEAGELCLGTIDCWLMFRLTGGARFQTDASNAARTLLMDLERIQWDDRLLELFRVPRATLPEIVDCSGDLGETEPSLLGRAVPIRGSAGDQQAALIGHGGLEPGTVKITYGTGAFLVAETGAPKASSARLLTTLAWRVGGRAAYALEGSIFFAGATIGWLRDGLGLIGASRDSEAAAQGLRDNGGVYLVPGFAGLGAPHWSAEARAAIVGLTPDAGRSNVVRAGLESLAYQTEDLLTAMAADGVVRPKRLKVDGGVTANAFAMQFLADICQVEVERPAFQEMTALGAARLAAMGAGLEVSGPEGEPAEWKPRMGRNERDRLLKGWRAAVRGVLEIARAGA